jgi:hypothetical protein
MNSECKATVVVVAVALGAYFAFNSLTAPSTTHSPATSTKQEQTQEKSNAVAKTVDNVKKAQEGAAIVDSAAKGVQERQQAHAQQKREWDAQMQARDKEAQQLRQRIQSEQERMRRNWESNQ